MQYEVNEEKQVIIMDGFYKGTVIAYDRVELVPSKDEEYLTLEFNYNIIDYKAEMSDSEPLIQLDDVAGDILKELIMEGLEKQSIVYSGGTE